jgi:hypothetical protein
MRCHLARFFSLAEHCALLAFLFLPGISEYSISCSPLVPQGVLALLLDVHLLPMSFLNTLIYSGNDLFR